MDFSMAHFDFLVNVLGKYSKNVFVNVKCVLSAKIGHSRQIKTLEKETLAPNIK
jgi:hypothetical protein